MIYAVGVKAESQSNFSRAFRSGSEEGSNACHCEDQEEVTSCNAKTADILSGSSSVKYGMLPVKGHSMPVRMDVGEGALVFESTGNSG